MAEEYLQTKVKGIVEPMMSEMLKTLPEEPMRFMLTWLINYSRGDSAEINGEREELENLRKEIKKYKNKEKENEKSKKQSEAESEKSEESKSVESEDVSSKEKADEFKEEQNEIDKEIQARRNKMMKRGQRSSVSAEVFGLYNKKSAFKPRVIPKKDSQKETIRKRCLQSFIFNSLEDQDFTQVIDAFEEKRFNAGDYVIKEGDQGDVVYLVDTGELDCEKTFKKGDKPTFLKTYYPGESFGELALLYNAPRAATIKAKTDCILWALDRGTFNNIVKEAAVKKREKYENSLKNVPILSTIDNYELGQICDAVNSAKAKKGDYIIKQGEKGDKFYILDEGEAYAAKVFNPGEEEQNVKDYKKGDYFGELALLRDEPRAASVIAKTDCKLITLDRLAFKRLLGPLEKLLQRNSEMYQKYNAGKK
jgi:cAMP-dependent protein kinase regulator